IYLRQLKQNCPTRIDCPLNQPSSSRSLTIIKNSLSRLPTNEGSFIFVLPYIAIQSSMIIIFE
ncbi:unnamed protein product, partial [Rotaria sp. Silwood2]